MQRAASTAAVLMCICLIAGLAIPAVGDGESERWPAQHSTVFLLDTSFSMAEKDKIRYAARNLEVMAAALSFCNLGPMMMGGPAGIEWSLMTFGGCHSTIFHDFVVRRKDVPDEVYAKTVDWMGGDTPLVWGVTRAIWHLYTASTGRTGSIVILSDGGEFCPERNPGGGEQSVMKLNIRLRKLNLMRVPTEELTAPPPQARLWLGGELLLAAGEGATGFPAPLRPQTNVWMPKYLGDDKATTDNALAEIDQLMTTRQMPITVHLLAIDMAHKPDELAAVRSLAEAGGGRFVQVDDPAGMEAALSSVTETVKQQAGLAGGTTPPPTTTPQPGPQPPTTVPPTTPPAAPGGPMSLDLTVCRDVVNGQLIDVADHFDQAAKVCAHWRFVDMPQGTMSTAVWTRNGAQYATANQAVSGTGTATYWVTSNDAGGHPAGTYQISILVGGQAAASRSFTIGAAPVGLAPAPPVTAPPPPPAPTPQAPPQPVVIGAGPDDLVLYRDNTGETMAAGRLVSFDGVSFGFLADGQLLSIARGSMLLVIVGDEAMTMPEGITAGTVVLRDGSLMSGTLTRFDGHNFEFAGPAGAFSLTREQVLTICVATPDW